MLTMTSMASGRFAPFGHAGPPRSLAKAASFPRCYGTQFTSSRFMRNIWARLGITRIGGTAYHHPEGNSYIERFHRSIEGGGSLDVSEYRSFGRGARASIPAIGSRSTITTGLISGVREIERLTRRS